jgi:hypothetical protein
MLGLNLSSFIEKNSDDLAEGLLEKLNRSDRTTSFRNIPPAELKRDILDLYANLTDWLIAKTERDIEARFVGVGERRRKHDVPLSELIWALLASKDHIWRFLQQRNTMDGALQIFGTLEFLRELDFFFERGIYYTSIGYERRTATGVTAA